MGSRLLWLQSSIHAKNARRHEPDSTFTIGRTEISPENRETAHHPAEDDGQFCLVLLDGPTVEPAVKVIHLVGIGDAFRIHFPDPADDFPLFVAGK